MKKFLSIILLAVAMFGSFVSFQTQAKTMTDMTREDMLVGQSSHVDDILTGNDQERTLNLGQRAREVDLKDDFLGTIQNYLFTLVGIVAVAMFIYTGFRLFSARGDEKEYSQAWRAFAYTVVGLVVIPLSFVLVKIVLGFTF